MLHAQWFGQVAYCVFPQFSHLENCKMYLSILRISNEITHVRGLNIFPGLMTIEMLNALLSIVEINVWKFSTGKKPYNVQIYRYIWERMWRNMEGGREREREREMVKNWLIIVEVWWVQMLGGKDNMLELYGKIAVQIPGPFAGSPDVWGVQSWLH